MSDWFVARNGVSRGPFAGAEVFELIARGQVARGDLVSFEGGQWFPIEESPNFAPSLPTHNFPYVPPPNLGYYPGPHTSHRACAKCGSQLGTYLETKVTTAGWIMFFVGLFSCVLFPLIFVGLSQKENVMFCKACRCRV